MPDFVQQSEAQSHALLQQFRVQHSIDPQQSPTIQLHQIAAAFSKLPYENLTKILRDSQTQNPDDLRRLPSVVLNDHIRLGTGGTCFSLTWTLLHLVRALGFQAEPILADRRYGPNTHSALVVWIDGAKHLLDPGYLLVNALPFPTHHALFIPTSFQEIQLTPEPDTNRVQLATIHPNKATYRLTYKTDPVDIAEFLQAWDNSFHFDMMSYPVLSKIADGKQLYLQKNHLLIRSKDSSVRQELDPSQLGQTIHQHFDLHHTIVSEALNLLHKK